MEITVRNMRDEAIFLGGPTLCQAEHIRVSSIAEPSLYWEGMHCKHACSDAQMGHAGCTTDCPQPVSVEVASGQSHILTWIPVLFEQVPLPAECCLEPSGACSADCFRPTVPDPGVYSITLALVDALGTPLQQIETQIELGDGDRTITID
jgi:hypothetical protein